jgi:hypothetical protein
VYEGKRGKENYSEIEYMIYAERKRMSVLTEIKKRERGCMKE